MSKNGFTLIEMMVAVAIFASVVTAVSMLFVSAICAQRQSLALQELLDQTSYVMEYMSRTIRMAKKDMDGACTGTAKLNYYFAGQCLKFKNYKGECQQFCLDGTAIKETIDFGAPIELTSPDLKIYPLEETGEWIELSGETQDDEFQPLVSILLKIEGKEQSKIQTKTSVSQRDLDVMK